jgi:diguanylate cyclase (GGDEF)-like protein/PAS domain S-box-containing protein
MSVRIPLTVDLCFKALMEYTADNIYFKDRKCRFLWASRKMADDLGFSDPDDLKGKTDVEVFGEQSGRRTMNDDTTIMETGKPIIGLIESRRLEDGQLSWTLTSKLPVYDKKGEVVGLMGVTRETGELKQNEKNLKHLATHDFLTDLPNRFLMYDRLEQVLGRAKRSRSAFAILHIDLAGFKLLNDSYGHDVGDAILRQVADRLKKCVRTSDTVARLGGDEFGIVLATLQKGEDAAIVADKVQECFDKPFTTKKGRVEVGASIGISLFPDHGKDAESLLKAADYAMYLSKQHTGRFVVCPKDQSDFREETGPD